MSEPSPPTTDPARDWWHRYELALGRLDRQQDVEDSSRRFFLTLLSVVSAAIVGIAAQAEAEQFWIPALIALFGALLADLWQDA